MNYDIQRQIAELRRQKYAQQADFQAPQGQMVGGHFVAPNPLQYLAAGLRSLGGMRGEQLATQELQDIEKQRGQAMASEGQALAQALRGTPAQEVAPTTPNDDMGNPNPMVSMPAVPGSYDAFLTRAMQSQFPEYQKIGMQGMVESAQAQAKQAQQAQLTNQYMQILQNSTPQQAIAAGVPADFVQKYMEAPNYGRAKVNYKDVGGQLVPVDEYGNTPSGIAPISKTGNPFSDILVRDANGQIVQNAPLVGAKTEIARAGKPIVNVDARNFNTQESEQSKAYGKSLGEIRSNITQAGYDANSKMAQLNRMEQLLGSLDAGGRAAPLMADVASVAASMGIKLDPKLGAKEAAQSLAIEMASNMRQPGTGPMTDKDFDNFLRRVPDLSKTPAGRQEITKTMRAALQRDVAAAKFARDYAKSNNGVIDDNFFDAMANFYQENPVVTPALPDKNARGQTLPKFDPAKEQRYQEWLKSQGVK